MSSSSILLSGFAIMVLFGFLTSAIANTNSQWVVIAAVIVVGLMTASAMGKTGKKKRYR